MSKTEIDYDHGVTLVEIDDAGQATFEHLPFTRTVPHLRLPARGALSPSARSSRRSPRWGSIRERRMTRGLSCI